MARFRSLVRSVIRRKTASERADGRIHGSPWGAHEIRRRIHRRIRIREHCACAKHRAHASAAGRDRGAYIVNGIGGCNDCHTPMTPQGPDMARSLHGARLIFAPTIDMPWAAAAPPLAGGRPSMSDEEFATFLQTGLRPDGSRAVPPMPQFRLNDEDARAVVAYIKTLPPRPENVEN